MTMIERMEAIEKRLLAVEERLQKTSGPCPTPGCAWFARAGETLCDNCASVPPGERERRAREKWVRPARDERERFVPLPAEGITVQPRPGMRTLHVSPVPDEVVRELEKAVDELIAWSDGPYVGDNRVSVELGRWRRLKAALGEATKARRKGSKDDADGAILVRDSSPISGQSGRSKAHRWLQRWGDAPLRYECEKCGETSIAGPGSALHSGPCPGKQTPTGSGPTPS